MDNDCGIFVKYDRVRSKLSRNFNKIAQDIPLYEVYDDLVKDVADSMRHAIVVDEQADEFCEQLRNGDGHREC